MTVRLLAPLALAAMLVSCSADEGIQALGTLERNRLTLTATAGELITEQAIAEGTLVKAGAVIVRLDTTRQQAAVARAEAEVAALSATLDKLRNGARVEELAAARARLDSSRVALTESERDFSRISDLVTRRVAPRADLDGVQALRDGNAARLRDAEAQLALLQAGSRIEDIAQVEAQLKASEAALSSEQLRLDELTLRAPREALLDSLPWEVGERVSAGATVAVLLEGGAPYARIYVPETRRSRVEIGQSVEIRVDGEAAPLVGTVRWISSDPAFTPYYALNGTERTRLVYLTEIDLPASAAALPAGLPAQLVLP